MTKRRFNPDQFFKYSLYLNCTVKAISKVSECFYYLLYIGYLIPRYQQHIFCLLHLAITDDK